MSDVLGEHTGSVEALCILAEEAERFGADRRAQKLWAIAERVEDLHEEMEAHEEEVRQWQNAGKTAIALLSSFRMVLSNEPDHLNLDACIKDLKDLHPEWNGQTTTLHDLPRVQ